MSSSPSALDHVNGLLRNVLRLLVPLSVTLTVYLYLYPFFLTCGFPLPAATATGLATDSQDGQLGAWFETVKLHLPLTTKPTSTASSNSTTTPSTLRLAPFRLLALGDPQLEGDTSIPNAYLDSSFPHLHSFFARLTSRNDEYPSFRKSTKQAFHDLVDFYFDDIPNTLESARKRVDHFGNDFYLAHIYRTLRWWAVPTHVSVLGDLVGSQWISDDEFQSRGDRFWRRAFAGAERVPDDTAAWPAATYDVAGTLGAGFVNETWRRRLLNVAGNHDIGYAGDLTPERMRRFERVYGKANYELRFELPPEVLSPAGAASIRNESAGTEPSADANEGSVTAPPADDRLVPELRIVVLNDMNLDTPAATPGLQDQTYQFVNDVINTASAVEYKGHFTVVLTHVPLYKAEGVCVDAPFFTFHDHDGTLKEQNQLSIDASKGFVEGIFGLSGDPTAPAEGRGRRGVVLNGHDHEGCDTFHFINQTWSEPKGEGEPQSESERENTTVDDTAQQEEKQEKEKKMPGWEATPWRNATAAGLVDRPGLPGVREITVRSMMGGYGGNAGLLSAWFDEASWEWRFEYAECPLGTQHIWWAAHVVDLITVALAGVYLVTAGVPWDKMTMVKTRQRSKEEGVREVKMNGNGNGAAKKPVCP